MQSLCLYATLYSSIFKFGVRWYTVNRVSQTNLILVAVDASCQCDNDPILDTRPTEVVHILYFITT